MKIWIDRDKMNQLAAMVNSLELESQRLGKMVSTIQEQVGDHKASMTTPPEQPKPEPKLLQCSVCHKAYDPTKREFHRQSWIPRSELAPDMLDFSNSKEGRALVRLCSVDCIEAAERKRYTFSGSFGGVPTKTVGHYRKST